MASVATLVNFHNSFACGSHLMPEIWPFCHWQLFFLKFKASANLPSAFTLTRLRSVLDSSHSLLIWQLLHCVATSFGAKFEFTFHH